MAAQADKIIVNNNISITGGTVRMNDDGSASVMQGEHEVFIIPGVYDIRIELDI